MKITSLGQAGLFIEINGATIVVDPYLSNNVEKFEPQNKRRLPIDPSYLNIEPDYLLITHNHLDHYDLETLKYYKDSKKTHLICPVSVYKDACVRFSDWTIDLVSVGDNLVFVDFALSVVKAYHSDKEAVGFILKIENKIMYIVGDSLYKEDLIENFPNNLMPDYLFVPVNGYGNNMNDIEANQLGKTLKAKCVIPYHYGMFDSLKFADLKIDNKKEFELYKTYEL